MDQHEYIWRRLEAGDDIEVIMAEIGAMLELEEEEWEDEEE